MSHSEAAQWTSAGSPPEAEAAAWYESNVRRYGYGYRALAFGRRSSQEKRFEALVTLGAFQGRSLLDVACGFGDLLAWLQARGIQPRYSGIDICPPMIARCRKRFPDIAERLQVADALVYEPGEPHDYVVASGLFGFAARNTEALLAQTFERLYSWCRIGMAVNFLSARYARRSEQRVYVEPISMLRAALRLTPAVRLDHSYLPNDFTLFLYRQPPWELKR
jgi:SAM-dependent methyltransferase